MEAGSDTTSSTLLTFILAMTNYPHVLKKAQEELDTVCGTNRSPTTEDFGHLPYMTACISEVRTIVITICSWTNLCFQVLRWRPIAAGGVPHALIQDEMYEGYFLPKGTILFANAWSIHRDEEEYEQPDNFIPERFLGNKFGIRPEAAGSQDDHRRITYAFGAGRRVCAGQRLAENSLVCSF